MSGAPWGPSKVVSPPAFRSVPIGMPIVLLRSQVSFIPNGRLRLRELRTAFELVVPPLNLRTYGATSAMKKSAIRSLSVVVSLGLMVMAGCDAGAPQRDGQATHPVSGIVTQGGTPVPGATVRFESADSSQASTGRTDSQGEYILATFEAGDGAPAGDYRVTIVKMQGPQEAATVSEDDPNYKGAEETVADVKVKNLLPEKYASVETSGLTAKVSEGPNNCDFQLE